MRRGLLVNMSFSILFSGSMIETSKSGSGTGQMVSFQYPILRIDD